MLPSRTGLCRGFVAQCRNIRALVLRDLMMRYGRDNIGFSWVILEPLLLTAGVMIVWSFTMNEGYYRVKLVEFILTGYMPLTLWRHMTNNVISIFRRSAPLLYHRSITLFDIFIARELLEFAGTTAALLIVWVSLYLVDVVGAVARLDVLFAGWLAMAWLGLGSGAIIAGLTERWDTAERFIQPLQYLSLPVSGVFFMVDWLPSWAQQAALLNPMVHCYELFRAGFFGDQMMPHYDLAYFSLWALGLSFVGVIWVGRSREWVQLS